MEQEVVVPPGVLPGAEVVIEMGDAQYIVTVPDGCFEGSTFIATLPFAEMQNKDVEVVVPGGCTAGDRFIVQLEDGDFEAVVPENCESGQRIVISLPERPNEPGDAEPERPNQSGDSEPEDELSGSSSDEEAESTAPRYPIGLPVEVMRSDGAWTLVTVMAYDPSGDTYTVQLVDGRWKYFVEPAYLRLPAFMLKTTAMI